MELVALPRVKLALTPTPLEALPRLSAALEGPGIYVKRDDCTGLAGGGNKTRQLEYILGDALAQGCDLLITHGAIQSNHVRQTAAAAARLGMDCRVLLESRTTHDDPEYLQSGNVLLNALFGAEMVATLPRGSAMPEACAELAAESQALGRRPYLIPGGGACGLGALGYVDGVFELLTQAQATGIAIDHICVASGSGGTQAGLLAGLQLAGSDAVLTGFSVGAGRPDQQGLVLELACAALALIKDPLPITRDAVHVCDAACGPGYGMPTAETLEAIEMVARLEGLLLDPVYTGKAMAGLIGMIRDGAFARTENVVFVHTGGLPSLFAYRRSF